MLGQLLFVGVGLGLNVPLAVIAVLAAAWQLRPPGATLGRGDLWLPAAAVAFALFFALRGDRMLLAFDFLATTVLTALSVAVIAGHRVGATPTILRAGRNGASRGSSPRPRPTGWRGASRPPDARRDRPR